MTSTKSEIVSLLDEEYSSYPQDLRWLIDNNRMRLIWQIEKVCTTVPKGGKVIDMGGGIIPFMVICQKIGYDTYLLDDFDDNAYKNKSADKILESISSAGVNIISGNMFDDSVSHAYKNSYDMVTTHDSIEHWHNSPKDIFCSLWEKMNENGVLWIGAPNCVNLRKRITVPFGKGKWSTMSDWYEEKTFRGHVREPDVSDYRYIANDLGAKKVKIEGKNWLGYRNNRKFVRKVIPYADGVMQIFPSICSDIYLYAWK